MNNIGKYLFNLLRLIPMDMRISIFMASLLITTPLYAATQTFYQSFNDLQAIEAEAGICTNCLFDSAGRFNSAINYSELNNPVYFPITSSSGAQRINPMKGTLSFWYKPTVDNTYTVTRRLLKIGKDNSGEGNFFIIGIYYDKDTQDQTKKHYLYFRHDGTTNCGVDPAPSCIREVSTFTGEPGVVMSWKVGEWHKITATWDFTAAESYMAIDVDGTFANKVDLNEAVSNTGFNPVDFHLGGLRTTYNDLPAKGMFDELKIYADPAFDTGNIVPMYIEITRDDSIWQAHETRNNTSDAPILPAGMENMGLIVYTNNAYGGYFPVYEGSVPISSTNPADNSIILGINTPLNLKATKNEYETAYIAMTSTLNNGDIVGTLSDFVSANGDVISSNSIKMMVVKNWFQSGRKPTISVFPVYTPELLVEDDVTPIQCGTVSDTNFKDGVSGCSASTLPSIPNNLGYFKTTLNSNITKQIAIKFHIPSTQKSGIYSGTLTTSSVGGSTVSLPINIEVSDFALESPSKIFGTYHQATPSNTSQATRLLELDDMAKHGLNSIWLQGDDLAFSNPESAKTAGLDMFATYYLPSPTAAKYLEAGNKLVTSGFEPYFYGQDEPYSTTERMVNHLKLSKNIHATVTNDGQTGKVITAITKDSVEKLNNPNSEIYTNIATYGTYTFAEAHLDFANLLVETRNTTSAGMYFQNLLNDVVQPTTYASIPHYRETYYWQIMQENPGINRYYSGIHLWLTKLDGIIPYVYQHIFGNPYDDFDPWSLLNYRDHFVTYPSQQGPVDTVQWEGLREGIDDYRLLQTWQTWYVQLSWYSPLMASNHKSDLDNHLAVYRDTDSSIYNTIKEGDFLLAQSSFSELRSWIINDIVAIKGEIDFDNDGINLPSDNCPSISNPNQTDADKDGIGNPCDIESITWNAVANEDGYVLESSSGSNTGGSVSTSSTTSYVGDSAQKREYKTFISVSGSTVPQNATVTEATLSLYKIATYGSPTSLGNLSALIAIPQFGVSGLTARDYQASPTINDSCGTVNTPTNTSAHTLLLSTACLNLLPNTSGIQLRLAYPDNINNSSQDNFRYGTGDQTTVSRRPVMTMKYILAD